MKKSTNSRTRPFTHKELAERYNVCWKTFHEWLKKHEHQVGKKMGHYFTPKQIKAIVELLGPPKKLFREGGV